MTRSAHQSLYRRVLGEVFDTLPLVLSDFHSKPSGATAQGTVRITRGPGWLRHLLCNLLRLPPHSESLPIRLQVNKDEQTECWIRYFGSLRLETKQWLYHDLLIETAGPLRFGFQVIASSTGMQFRSVRCWLLGIPLPAALSPQVSAVTQEDLRGWRIRVRIDVPILGMLMEYEGVVIPQC